MSKPTKQQIRLETIELYNRLRAEGLKVTYRQCLNSVYLAHKRSVKC